MGDFEQRLSKLSPRQRRLLARRLGGEAVSSPPVAVVGMACRFPGGADDPESYWQLLSRGGDAIRPVPTDRWDPRTTLDPEIVARGGFLDRIDGFDAAFFGISPREASWIDPQHRLLLEVAWEALEDAGITPTELKEGSAGVFAALYQRDFLRSAYSDPRRLDAYAASGTHHSIAANRLSYWLDLQGPSLVVDTACSSSLVAVHLAIQSLARGECDTAVVGAVNLMLLPEETLALSRWGMLAPDHRCKTFDARADGFVRGEGCGVVVLERLDEAQRKGRSVHATLLGTAVNQDGRSNGLTAPNGEAQQRVIRQALRVAEVEAREISYVEAHGTGTQLGDPIEVEALVRTLGEEGPDCVLGSTKANLGHLEAAAGMAGLLKTVLCLKHRAIPPQIHFERPNPLLPLDGGRFRVTDSLRPWDCEGPLRAGVSSFGMGGTNAHVILGEAPTVEESEPGGRAGAHLLPFSARSPGALTAILRALRQHFTHEGAREQLSERQVLDQQVLDQQVLDQQVLDQQVLDQQVLDQPPVDLGELAATLAHRRAHHPHRAALVVSDLEDLGDRLDEVSEGDVEKSASATAAPAVDPGLVFVFPGQGWQWTEMGRTLADETVFAETLTRCAEAVADHSGFDVLDAWHRGPEAGGWHDIDRIQPLLFSLQVALASQWRAWGVEPDAVVGHSLGEVAASHVAGALGLDDAARVICRRSRLLRRVRGGAMAAVDLDRAATEEILADAPDGLAIAAENGPRSTVLSGDPEALDTVLGRLAEQQVFARRIQVDVASHSPWVDPLRDDLLAELAPLAPRVGAIPIFSTVQGRRVDGSGFDARYWSENLRRTVLFRSAIEQTREAGHGIFVEISAHPILLPALREGFPGEELALVASGRRGRDARTTLLEALAEIYRLGREPAWGALTDPPRRRVNLPTYPWQRQSFPPPEPNPEFQSGGTAIPTGAGSAELFGAVRLPLSALPGVEIFETVLDPDRQRFLDHHRVAGTPIVPGVATVTSVLAILRAGGAPNAELLDVRYVRPLGLDPIPRVQWVLFHDSDDESAGDLGGRFEIRFCPVHATDGPWTLHAQGRFRAGAEETPLPDVDLDRARQHCSENLDAAAFYASAETRGVHWGPAFRGIETLARGEGAGGRGEVVVELRVPEMLSRDAESFVLHPALLDAAGQALHEAVKPEERPRGPFVLGEIESARVLCSPAEESFWARLRIRETREPGRLRGNVEVFDRGGRRCAEILGLAIDFLEHREGARLDQHLYAVEWQECPLAEEATSSARWWIVPDAGGVAEALVRRLTAAGVDCALVTPTGNPLTPAPGVGDLAQEGFHLLDLRGLDLLWLDVGNLDRRTDTAATQRIADLGIALLDLARVQRDRLAPGGLWWVTTGARNVDGQTAISPEAATLWGLGRSLAAEHGELLGPRIDLDPGTEGRLDIELAATTLERELLAAVGAPPEPEVAWRGGRRWVPRLRRRAPQGAGAQAAGVEPIPARLRTNGTYLVTGGLGGLGLATARRLVACGARRLILLGRRALPPRREWSKLDPESAAGRKVAVVRALEARGASVELAAVDVADGAALGTLLRNHREEGWPPIRGVVHAAGVQEPRPVFDLDATTLRAELAAKLQGARNLLRHLPASPLDFVVFFSSGAVHLGSPFLAGYTAANQALVAVAEEGRRQGWPVRAIAWGFWSEVGMAERLRTELGRDLAPQGHRSFSPERGTELLARMLGAEAPTDVAVLPADWRAWAEAYPTAAADPLFSELLSDRSDGIEEVATTSQGGAEAPLRQRLTEAEDDTERRTILDQALRRRVGQVLRLDSTEVATDIPLVRQGLDSLMAIEIRNRIQAELDLEIPILRLLGDDGLGALVDHLAGEVEKQLSAGEAEEDFEEWVI